MTPRFTFQRWFVSGPARQDRRRRARPRQRVGNDSGRPGFVQLAAGFARRGGTVVCSSLVRWRDIKSCPGLPARVFDPVQRWLVGHATLPLACALLLVAPLARAQTTQAT